MDSKNVILANPLTLEQLKEKVGEVAFLPEINCKVLVTKNEHVPLFTFSDGTQTSAKDWYENVGQAYEYPLIDRNKWEPCKKCKSCASCTWSIVNPNELPCSQCEHYCNYIPRKYCLECGRPLTGEAWEQLEKRIKGEWA